MADLKTERWKQIHVGKNCRWTPASSNLSLSTVGHHHLKADDNSSPKYSNANPKAACLNLAVQKFVWESETENPKPIFSLPFADFVVNKAHSSSLEDTPSFSALQVHLNANRHPDQLRIQGMITIY